MQITLAIQCDDGSIHPRWQRTIEVADEATARLNAPERRAAA